jgi:voltage-gated potassium channel
MGRTDHDDKPGFRAHRGAREEKPRTPLGARIHEIIFEADTPSGKAFDVALLMAIVLSVLAVMLDSVGTIRARHGETLYTIEWIFTIVFSIEYLLRLACVRKPWSYALSIYGVIDLLAVVPTYLSLFLAGAQTLLIIRILRLLRIFRVFKLARFLGEGRVLWSALKASRHKIVVFLAGVLGIVCIMGTLMYLIEGPEHGFTSIPRAVYWAIVTMTTVGYGDIAPRTVAGQAIAALVMIMGYAIIAVPTGIVSVEMAQATRKVTTQACPSCSAEGHDPDAAHCKHCGAKL